MVVISVYTYGVKIIKKFQWESGFLWGGSMEPPLCTNESAGYLMQLSVKPGLGGLHFEKPYEIKSILFYNIVAFVSINLMI